MLEFKAHDFIAAMNTLGDLESIGRQDASWVYQDADRIEVMTFQLDKVIRHVTALDLKQSKRKAEFMKALLGTAIQKPPVAFAGAFTSNLTELRDRIVGELEERAIYFVEDNKAEFLRLGAEPFGQIVSERFPNTSEDISEAANCLAMSRNTAVVFHLMRVMEVAVRRLGEVLGCTVIDKNNVELEWGKILANIGDRVAQMSKGPVKDEWSSVVTLLYHVKQAWRNSTMHPKQTYTDAEALSAFNAVKSFVSELSALEAP